MGSPMAAAMTACHMARQANGDGALRLIRTPEHKTVTTWVEKTCPSQDLCKPHLVGIRDSFQVSCPFISEPWQACRHVMRLGPCAMF